MFTALTSLDPSKAMGIDCVGPKILKKCALALYQAVHHLFSLSLLNHYIPEEWRVHRITPIFKSGDKSSVKNYRPISLLCTISKVLERVVYNHIIDFVTQSISPRQFGFLRKRSTLQQLLIFLNTLYNSFTDNTSTDVIYLDFKKAFDSVAHNELLVKLWEFGITGNLWKWFRAYLGHRRQCVSLNGCTSNTLPVISGVPQGSILGPILFLVFVNDLPSSVFSSTMYLFADDTKCLKRISNVGDSVALQQDLNLLNEWSKKWNLFFNVMKCVSLSFCSSPSVSQSRLTYRINSQTVDHVEHYKDLGIVLTHNLSWESHYEYILSNGYKMLGLLRRTFSNVGCVQAKKVLYLSLVRSKLTYCSQIWRPQFLKDIQSLESIQRRATKYILSDYSSDYKSRLVYLQLFPLMMQFELNDIMFLVTSIQNPSTSFNILQYITFSTSSTRASVNCKLLHHAARTNKTRHFYLHRVPRLWNSLPAINLNQSVASIRHKLREFLWCHFLDHFSPDNPCTFHFVCPCANCAVLPVSYNFNHSAL